MRRGHSGAGVYRRLLAEPGSARLAAADVCARLPQGMLSLTVLLAAAQRGSMTGAGLALAGCTVGLAVTAPVRGRLADRYGLARVAAVCCAGFALAVAGLLLAAADGQPTAPRVALAVAAGCLMPPLSPGMRSLWSVHVPAGLMPTAFALDAAVFDLAYITGPVLASALAVGVAPAAAAGAMVALTGAAIVIIAGAGFRQLNAGAGAAGFSLGPLRSAALRELLIVAGLANVALSATEVALTSYVRLLHVLWAAGPLLAELSAGSILGSLLLGARAGAGTAPRLPRLLAGYAAGLVLLAAAGAWAPLLALATPLAGLCLGPTLATLFTAAAGASPPGRSTEAQAWINSMMNGGAAAGAAVAGLSASRPDLGLVLAACAAAAAALLAARTGRWAGRNRVAPPSGAR
ncbi:MAG TPA: MFS transporter [Streptosporangiaceae bacterium]|nr:MFS transporter [Streptosporangiaceae bacterium]